MTKDYVLYWSEEVFMIKKNKNIVLWSCVINNFDGEKIVGRFYKKELQKTNQEQFSIEKIIKKNGDKLYVKLKSYDNS